VNPRILAASADGAYLYVANQTDLTVQRINLQTNTVERTFAYTPNLYCSSCYNVPATDLEVVPGSPKEVLLSQGSWLTLYNDTGSVNYVPNDGICCYADPDFGSIALAGNPLTIYGLPFLISGRYFQTANLTASELTYTRLNETNLGGNNTTGAQVISDGTLLYTSGGQIWNPATQTEVGTFPVTTIDSASFPNTFNLILDTSLGEIYTIGDQSVNGGDSVVITAYGLTSHAVNATLMFPQIESPDESNLVRWGTNGFAFIGPSTGLLAEVYLVRTSATSAFALSPAPVLNSVSPITAVIGGASFTVTANGSSFLADSVIDWNGTPLVTKVVSGTQLTALVPASDIVQASVAQISVYTPGPGGGSSTTIPITISSSTPLASLSASSLSFGNVSQSVSSSAQTVSLANPGNALLTISGITTTGDFTSTNNCGSSLAAGSSCTISVIFMPSTAGTLIGALSVADGAPSSPQTVSLTGNGVTALTIAPQQGGSTTANVTIGNPATYSLSIGGGPGFSGATSLTCSGAPQYTACSITPSTVTVASGSNTNFTVTVSTTQTVAANRPAHGVAFAGLGVASLFSLSLLLSRKRRLISLCCFLLAASVSLFGISGCAGSSSSNGSGGSTQIYATPPGTYTLTVTATAGSDSTTQNLTLIVN
jgi:hypothetical protein